MDEPIDRSYDAELLTRLVGMSVAKWTAKWDEERKLFRELYDIKKITGVELEVTPNKMVVLKFADGDRDFILSLDQTSKYIGRIGDCGSIHEYLLDRGFSLFK